MTAFSKKILVFVLALVAIGAVYLTFSEPAEVGQLTDLENAIESGEAPYLSALKDLKGEPVEMSKGKLVFLNVWATWCGPCNIEMPGIQRLYDRYKDNSKVAFYIVSDEDAGTVNPFIARKGYQLPFYQFTGAYPAALDGNAIPRTYIIYDGKILAQEIGASQWDRPEIVDLIEKHIAEI